MPNFSAQELYDAIIGQKVSIVLGKRIAKAAGLDPDVFVVDPSHYPLSAITKMFIYGVRRDFNDDVGGSDIPIPEKIKLATQKDERYRRGEIGRVAAETADPVQEMARTLAFKMLLKDYREHWDAFVKAAGKEDFAKKKRAELDRVIANNPSLIDDAKAELKRLAEKPKIALKL